MGIVIFLLQLKSRFIYIFGAVKNNRIFLCPIATPLLYGKIIRVFAGHFIQAFVNLVQRQSAFIALLQAGQFFLNGVFCRQLFGSQHQGKFLKIFRPLLSSFFLLLFVGFPLQGFYRKVKEKVLIALHNFALGQIIYPLFSNLLYEEIPKLPDLFFSGNHGIIRLVKTFKDFFVQIHLGQQGQNKVEIIRLIGIPGVYLYLLLIQRKW